MPFAMPTLCVGVDGQATLLLALLSSGAVASPALLCLDVFGAGHRGGAGGGDDGSAGGGARAAHQGGDLLRARGKLLQGRCGGEGAEVEDGSEEDAEDASLAVANLTADHSVLKVRVIAFFCLDWHGVLVVWAPLPRAARVRGRLRARVAPARCRAAPTFYFARLYSKGTYRCLP